MQRNLFLSPEQVIGFFIGEQSYQHAMGLIQIPKQTLLHAQKSPENFIELNIADKRFYNEFEQALNLKGVHVQRIYRDDKSQDLEGLSKIEIHFESILEKHKFLDSVLGSIASHDSIQDFMRYLEADAIRFYPDQGKRLEYVGSADCGDVTASSTSEPLKIGYQPREISPEFLKKQKKRGIQELGEETYSLMKEMVDELLAPDRIQRYADFVDEFIYKGNSDNRVLTEDARKLRHELNEAIKFPTARKRIDKLLLTIPELHGTLKADEKNIAKKIPGVKLLESDFDEDTLQNLERSTKFASELVQKLKIISKSLEEKSHELLMNEANAER